MTAIYEVFAERQTLAAERQAVALERIAAAIETFAGLALQPTPACAHPLDEREDTGSTMGHERWRCKLCGFEVTS